MKRIKGEWASLLHKILGSFLVMLGFSACENVGLCMYGAPNADFKIKGTVTDEAGKPIPSAEVIIRWKGYDGKADLLEGYYDNEGFSYMHDTLKVDSDGRYSNTRNEGDSSTEFRIVARDMAHEADSVDITMVVPKDAKDKGEWFMGTAEETVNFTLKKK